MSTTTMSPDVQRTLDSLTQDGMTDVTVSALWEYTEEKATSDQGVGYATVLHFLAVPLWNDRWGMDVCVKWTYEMGIPTMQLEIRDTSAPESELSADRIMQRQTVTVWMATDPPQQYLEQGVIALPHTQDLAVIAERLLAIMNAIDPLK